MTTTKKKAPLLDHIASNIKFLRTLSSLSQEQLAERIGLNRGNITSYERGIAKPSIDSLQKIADCFNVDLLSLIQKDLSTNMDSNQIKQLYAKNNQTKPQEQSAKLKMHNSSGLTSLNGQATNGAVDFEQMLKGLRDINDFQVQMQQSFYQDIHSIAQQLQQLTFTMENLVKVSQEILKEVKQRKRETVG